MKRIKILTVLIFLLIIGCGSSNKILGIIELNKTTRNDLSNLNLEMNNETVFNEDKGIYIYNYIYDYTDYEINGVKGIIHIPFGGKNDAAQSVNFSTDATEDNMNKIIDYLIDTYGKDHEEVEDYTTRWTSGNLIIDYVLTDDNTVEIIWYDE